MQLEGRALYRLRLAIIKGPPNDIYFIIEGPYDGYFTEKVSQVHIAKLNGRLCGAKRPHSVSEQPNFYQSLQSNPYNDSSHPSGGE